MSDPSANQDGLNPEGSAPVDPVTSQGYKALKDEGIEGKKIEVRERDFRVAEEIPAIVLLDLGLASDPTATQGEQLRALRGFIHSAIHADDVDAFEHLLRTAAPAIGMDELNGYVEKLVEMTAGRPTD